MTEAKRDDNYVTVAMGAASDDSTTLPFLMDPVTDYLLVDITVDGLSATSATQDQRDDNGKPTMYGISSTDPNVLVPIRTDEQGRLLVTII